MIVPISDRARKYGYLFWPKSADAEIRTLLAGVETVDLSFNGSAAGTKSMDWRHRRISIGPKRTRDLPAEAISFVLDFRSPTLIVTYR